MNATTDSVTGAYSRALLEPRMAAEVARAGRVGGACSLFLFDVDFFKTVNDAYGHQRGDDVLRLMAERVRAMTRSTDELFRYGGDEFVVLLPDTRRGEAVRLALAVVAELAREPFAGTPPLHVSISLGVASYPDDAGNDDELLACADRRNYLAKARGRGCAVADDADTAADGDSGSRLWERDTALAAVHGFLTSVEVTRAGALPVTGPPGAGHTRFLAEVERVARLRGFATVLLEPGAPVPDVPAADGAKLLLLADVPAAEQVPGVVAALRTDQRQGAVADERQYLPAVLAVVYASLTGPLECGLRNHAAADLAPWSAAALRIWLRNTLRGEPSETLLGWLAERSGGLPAEAVRQLDRLRAQGHLESTADGRWTVGTAALGRARRRTDLPVAMTELVGREAERARITELLDAHRLVTLTGPGGMGKTRLAMAAAAELCGDFESGAVFVPLADTAAPDRVLAEIAAALEVSAAPGQSLLDGVVAQLAEVSLLLVLDNFEQVLGAAGVVSDLLRRVPGIKVLVTSRERLALYGERVYKVPPLALPDLAALPTSERGVARTRIQSPAVDLFEQRAQAIDDEFGLSVATLPAVAALCHRLDGLPLAIELAAARIDRWPPQLLLTHLENHLDALGDGPRDLPERQRTLRGAIDWSFALLDPAEQRLFTWLAAFGGGFTAEAAAAVCDTATAGAAPVRDMATAGAAPVRASAEGGTAGPQRLAEQLAALAGKSLLLAETAPDGVRYRMLETIRAYAVARLAESPAQESVRGRHAGYYATLADAAGVGLTGPDQAVWMRRLEVERPNLREALGWTVGGSQRASWDLPTGARICIGVWRYWRNTAIHIEEGRVWLGSLVGALQQDPEALDDRTAAAAYYAAAALAAEAEDHGETAQMAAAALHHAERAGDRDATASAHLVLGVAAITRGDDDVALGYLQHALSTWRQLCQPAGISMALANLAQLSLQMGDLPAALAYAEESIALERDAGNTRHVLLGLECVADVLLAQRDAAGARPVLRESLALCRELGDPSGEAKAVHQSGLVALFDGDRAEALRLLVDAARRRHELDDRQHLAVSLDTVAHVVAADDAPLAAELLAAADALRARCGLPTPADDLRAETFRMVEAALPQERLTAAFAAGKSASVDLVVSRVVDAAVPAR